MACIVSSCQYRSEVIMRPVRSSAASHCHQLAVRSYGILLLIEDVIGGQIASFPSNNLLNCIELEDYTRFYPLWDNKVSVSFRAEQY